MRLNIALPNLKGHGIGNADPFSGSLYLSKCTFIFKNFCGNLIWIFARKPFHPTVGKKIDKLPCMPAMLLNSGPN